MLCHNNRVVYEADGVRTAQQGHWSSFTTHTPHDFARILSVTFSSHDIDVISKMKNHLFVEICPGFWRGQHNYRVIIFEDEFHLTRGLWMEGLPRFEIPSNHGTAYKHFFVWLHPAKAAAFLALTHDNKIIFVGHNEDADEPKCPANGYYEYRYLENGVDFWFLHFHCSGNPHKMQSTVMKRISGRCPVWRACGDNHEFASEDQWGLREWHIVMVQLV